MALRLVHDGGDRERMMFGCTEQEVKERINRLVDMNFGNVNMTLGAILTSAQARIDEGIPENMEQVRHELNRVKLALFLAAPMKLWERLK